MSAPPGGEHHHAARLADGEGRARVDAEVQVLQRDGVGLVLVQQLADALEDGRQPPRRLERGRCLDDAAVEREQPAALLRDDAVAGVGHARVDAEDDHVHVRDSARRAGRLQPPGSDEPAKPKNQTANASAATPTETIITRSSTPPRRSTLRSPRIERVQPGR